MTAGSRRSQSKAVHERAVIINGLGGLIHDPTRAKPTFTLPAVMHRGGTTAVNFTVALTESVGPALRNLAGLLDGIDATNDPPTRLALTARDILKAKEEGGVAIIVGFQGSEPIEDSLEYLEIFYRLGLRVLQLTYQRRNLLGDGSGEPANAGLSSFGRQVIQQCNRLGILIDLSHVGDRTTMETIDASEEPVAFTHVNRRAVVSLPRNKTDEQLKAVAARGGVIGINSIARLLSPHGRERGATLDEYVDQMEQVIDLVGIDHVGIGLDVNEDMTVEDFGARRPGFLASYPELSAGGDFPFEHYYVKGMSMGNLLPLTENLLQRGLAEEDVIKVLGGNFLRLFESVWG